MRCLQAFEDIGKTLSLIEVAYSRCAMSVLGQALGLRVALLIMQRCGVAICSRATRCMFGI
jgi:hypothetical protein